MLQLSFVQNNLSYKAVLAFCMELLGLPEKLSELFCNYYIKKIEQIGEGFDDVGELENELLSKLVKKPEAKFTYNPSQLRKCTMLLKT